MGSLFRRSDLVKNPTGTISPNRIPDETETHPLPYRRSSLSVSVLYQGIRLSRLLRLQFGDRVPPSRISVSATDSCGSSPLIHETRPYTAPLERWGSGFRDSLVNPPATLPSLQRPSSLGIHQTLSSSHIPHLFRSTGGKEGWSHCPHNRSGPETFRGPSSGHTGPVLSSCTVLVPLTDE